MHNIVPGDNRIHGERTLDGGMGNIRRSDDVWVTCNLHNWIEQDGRTAQNALLSRPNVTAVPGAASRPGAASNLASPKAPLLPTRKLILVVDDDPSMLKVIKRILKVHGFDAELFSSASEFESRANLREATCLVLDIDLKGESGIELRRRIAQSGISIPAIFVTGKDNATNRKAAQDADCSAFLVKPFPMKSLIDAIAAAAPAELKPE